MSVYNNPALNSNVLKTLCRALPIPPDAVDNMSRFLARPLHPCARLVAVAWRHFRQWEELALEATTSQEDYDLFVGEWQWSWDVNERIQRGIDLEAFLGYPVHWAEEDLFEAVYGFP